jgi:hypothetical protein
MTISIEAMELAQRHLSNALKDRKAALEALRGLRHFAIAVVKARHDQGDMQQQGLFGAIEDLEQIVGREE